MIKILSILFITLIMCLLPPASIALADNVTPLKEGDELPSLQLATPETLQERNYLGIAQEGFFTIPKIKSTVVIMYFFSLYCPFCAKQAVLVNDLYSVIDNNPDLKKKIKFIGIGIGNTAMEVDTFKDTYRILFPLIPDTDFAIHKAYGQIMTPYFFVVRINEDGTHKIVICTYAFNDVNEFLRLILTKSGLTKQEK